MGIDLPVFIISLRLSCQGKETEDLNMQSDLD